MKYWLCYCGRYNEVDTHICIYCAKAMPKTRATWIERWLGSPRLTFAPLKGERETLVIYDALREYVLYTDHEVGGCLKHDMQTAYMRVYPYKPRMVKPWIGVNCEQFEVKCSINNKHCFTLYQGDILSKIPDCTQCNVSSAKLNGREANYSEKY